MRSDDIYRVWGDILGSITAILVFIGAWIYCISAYGFLLGVGLGWLAAGISAGAAFLFVRWLWPAILVVAVLLVLKLCTG